MQRVTLTLDDDLLAALDALSARRGYHNRSEAVRDILRDALNQDPPSPESRRGYAVLSYVYEHEKRELASRLVATQHHHHDLSVATLHVHISHDDCLEIAVLKGDMELSLFANNGASFNDLVMARLLHKYKLPPCWYRERPLREIQASIESRCCQGNFWRS